jgi:hypothetical protein
MSRNKLLRRQPEPKKEPLSEAKLKAFISKTYKEKVQELRQKLCKQCHWQKETCKEQKLLPVTSKGDPCPYFQKITV